MWPFKKELDKLHSSLENSFAHVKQDTQTIHQWLQHLHQKNQVQEQLLAHLHQRLQHHEFLLQHHQNQLQSSSPPSSLSYQHFHQRLEQLSQKVDLLLEKHHSHSQKLEEHHQKLDLVHQKLSRLETSSPKPSLKEKIIRTFSHHSKKYLKNLIFNYLEQHQKISALQLKDIIVDQQGLASKSTFYRILAEIEVSGQVTVIKDGKEKIFLYKPIMNQ